VNDQKKTPRFSSGPNGRCSMRHLRRHTSRTVWDSSFSVMNGWEVVSAKLEPGDQARFQYESRLESGSLAMELVEPSGSTVFRWEGTQSGTYVLTASLAGRYSARATADHAAGGFRLELLPAE
jgi:hypothetical protein